MGLFESTKPASDFHEIFVVVLKKLEDALTDRLDAIGVDLSNAAMRSRVRATVMRFSYDFRRTLQLGEARKLARKLSLARWPPTRLDRLVDIMVEHALTEILVMMVERPPIPRDAVGVDRFGPNFESVQTFFARLRDMPAQRWQGVSTSVYRSHSLPRFNEFRARAWLARDHAVSVANRHDELAWAEADAKEQSGAVIERIYRELAPDYARELQEWSADARATLASAAADVKEQPAAVHEKVFSQVNNKFSVLAPYGGGWRDAQAQAGHVAGTLVVWDQLSPEYQAVLVFHFGPEVMGPEQWEQAQRRLDEAQIASADSPAQAS